MSADPFHSILITNQTDCQAIIRIIKIQINDNEKFCTVQDQECLLNNQTNNNNHGHLLNYQHRKNY